MTTDHNEAMSQLPHKLATLIKCLPQAPFRDHLAAECIKQAERIAELEAARDKWKSAEHALSNSYVRVRAAIGAICPPSLETAELWAYVEATALALTAERDTLRTELETERMRLVACGVVAMANTAESAAKARDMHPDYLCASVRDVAAAVDREMALRAEVERLRVDAERYRWLRSAHWSDAPLCCVLEPKANVRLGATCPSGDQLDTAIDTARKATQ